MPWNTSILTSFPSGLSSSWSSFSAAAPFTPHTYLTQTYFSTNFKGFLITDITSNATGYWQLYTPETHVFSTITATPSQAIAVRAHPAFQLRFVPTQNLTSSYQFRLAAWDLTDFSDYSIVNTTEPFSTRKLISSLATRVPNFLVIPFSSNDISNSLNKTG